MEKFTELIYQAFTISSPLQSLGAIANESISFIESTRRVINEKTFPYSKKVYMDWFITPTNSRYGKTYIIGNNRKLDEFLNFSSHKSRHIIIWRKIEAKKWIILKKIEDKTWIDETALIIGGLINEEKADSLEKTIESIFPIHIKCTKNSTSRFNWEISATIRLLAIIKIVSNVSCKNWLTERTRATIIF